MNNTFQSFPSAQSNSIVSKTANYTLTISDGTVIGATPSSAAYTLTIPLAASMSGQIFKIKMSYNDISKNITLARTSTDVFSFQGTTATSLTMFTLDEEYEIQSDGATTWYVLNHKTTTDWASIALVPNSSGFGTISSGSYVGRRVGDSLEVMGSFVAGTVAGSPAKVALPSGYVVDTAKVNTTKRSPIGTMWVCDDSTDTFFGSTNRLGPCFIDNSDTANFYMCAQGSSSNYRLQDVNGVFSNLDTFTFNAKIPISGWKS